MVRPRQPVWRGTNLARIGDFNESVLVDAIRRSPDGLSRVELVTATGLSPQTISNIARRMIDAGLVVEGERLKNGVGKPRTLLRLEPGGAYALGVHLDPQIMTFVLLDLHGRVVEHTRRVTPTAAAPDEVIAEVVSTVTGLVDAAGVDPARLVGIGFASPGPIDVDAGIVLDPPYLPDWRNVPLRDCLAEATGLPAILDKDVVAAAVGERWAGAAVGHRSCVFLYLGTGIGTGVVADDHVLRGTSGNAGDVGHLLVTDVGPVCPCGRRGCLGAVLRPAGIVEQAVALGALPADTPTVDLDAVDAALVRLAESARDGMPEAQEVMRVTGSQLAHAARTLVNLFDTDILVLGGPTWARLGAFWLDDLSAAVRAGLVRGEDGEHGDIVVTGTELGEGVGAIGAASLALDRTFSPRPSSFVLG
jgi:predicted NBD/HSP70 family sugar kinase